MKLILEGELKKVKQIKNELIYRCKRDKIHMSVIDEIEVSKSIEEPKKSVKPKK